MDMIQPFILCFLQFLSLFYGSHCRLLSFYWIALFQGISLTDCELPFPLDWLAREPQDPPVSLSPQFWNYRCAQGKGTGKITRATWKQEKGACGQGLKEHRASIALGKPWGPLPKCPTLGKGPSWGTRNSIIEYISCLSNILFIKHMSSLI